MPSEPTERQAKHVRVRINDLFPCLIMGHLSMQDGTGPCPLLYDRNGIQILHDEDLDPPRSPHMPHFQQPPVWLVSEEHYAHCMKSAQESADAE